MALFGNENKKTIEELENYYSNKTQRTGMAWAMAFLSLLITVAVLGGLFFGGRWLYRSLTDNASTPIAQQNDKNDSGGSVIGDLGLSLNGGQDSEESEGEVTDEAASTSEPNTDTVATVDVQDTTNDTGPQVAASTTERPEGELPDTGATTSIFVGIPFVSFVAAYIFARNRQLN